MTSMPSSALAIAQEETPQGETPQGEDTTPTSATRSRKVENELVDEPIAFSEIYERHFDFVWRVARRLGVAASALDDVVQETFLVVHRRLDEPRTSSLRTWIYGIAVLVVRNHRRSVRRKSPHATAGAGIDPDTLPDARSEGPEVHAQKAEAARVLYAILESLDEDKREVFVLVELEQLGAADVAKAIDVKLNTVYSRLRLARAEFEEGVRRHRARDDWRAK
jgi:RNA polymerase sigma-70 factor (ECF subfamily)